MQVVFIAKNNEMISSITCNTCKTKIFTWKCDIMQGVNQEQAKQDPVHNLSINSFLIVIDWAMKFDQMRYREKQKEWYGKCGLSWNTSRLVTYDKQSRTTCFVPCASDLTIDSVMRRIGNGGLGRKYVEYEKKI